MGKLDTIVMRLLTRSWASLMPLLCVYCHGPTVFCDFVPNSREIVYAFLGHVGGKNTTSIRAFSEVI